MLDGLTIAYLLSADKHDEREEQRKAVKRCKPLKIYFEIRPIFFGHPPVFLPGISEGTFSNRQWESDSDKYISSKQQFDSNHRAVFLPHVIRESFLPNDGRLKLSEIYFSCEAVSADNRPRTLPITHERVCSQFGRRRSVEIYFFQSAVSIKNRPDFLPITHEGGFDRSSRQKYIPRK